MSKNYQTDENGAKLTEDGEVVATQPEEQTEEETKQAQSVRTEVATCIGFAKFDKATKKGKLCMANFVLGNHDYFQGLLGADLKFGSKWFESDLSEHVKLGGIYEIDYSNGLNGAIFVKAVRPYVKQTDFS